MAPLIIFFALIFTGNIGLAKIKSIQPSKSKNQNYLRINPQQKKLLKRLVINPKNKTEIEKTRKMAFNLSGKSVPVLMKVMQSEKFPDRSRWLATFLMAQIMGKKSKKFLAKFLDHKQWILRMAAIKALQMLKAKEYIPRFEKALFDKAMVVRVQALKTLRELNIKSSGPKIMQMLKDENNFLITKSSKAKTSIVTKIIKTLGELKYVRAKKLLLSWIKDKKNQDVFFALNGSLEKITGKKAPRGNESIKRNFWKKYRI